MPDAAEPAARGDRAAGRGDVRLQHRAHRLAQPEVGEADDAGADAHLAVDAAGAHGGDAVDELGLAHRLHRLRPRRAVHRPRLHEHGGAHVVAGADVGQHVVEQVAPAGPVPQVVVRVDDELARIQRLLLLRRQPVGADRDVVRLRGRAHGAVSGYLRPGAAASGSPALRCRRPDRGRGRGSGLPLRREHHKGAPARKPSCAAPACATAPRRPRPSAAASVPAGCVRLRFRGLDEWVSAASGQDPLPRRCEGCRGRRPAAFDKMPGPARPGACGLRGAFRVIRTTLFAALRGVPRAASCTDRTKCRVGDTARCGFRSASAAFGRNVAGTLRGPGAQGIGGGCAFAAFGQNPLRRLSWRLRLVEGSCFSMLGIYLWSGLSRSLRPGACRVRALSAATGPRRASGGHRAALARALRAPATDRRGKHVAALRWQGRPGHRRRLRRAGRGNGRAVAVGLAREGAAVGRRGATSARMAETAEWVAAEGRCASSRWRCDVTDGAAVRASSRRRRGRHGRIDVLVNSVGGSAAGGPVELAEEVWDLPDRHQPEERVPPLQARHPGHGAGAAARSSTSPRPPASAGPARRRSPTRRRKAGVIQLSRVVAVQYAARAFG